ncbi:uncharacterized protein DUF4249 [Anseongella ginsenosidimutans]|uniref:Uncharacterized protein DUF4249 n=1 Tax=Anseongella ginsenosidimutans TaxID=496056 RepID=A0A4R3KW51_9SPHI|nr:DUF4249 domain-containing protein [Anseongella ginsenosidimutans]QEC51616.1 DUF4249 domain-containing protein [Anseongella ginsenosidimutans]TCS88946.1 uncharacterized protein DUF4249 [Anseongella ginsenosidimutans]
MRALLRKYGNYLLAMILLTGCKDPFELPEVTAGKPLLVVEGFLNGGGGETLVRLSYTSPFSGEDQPAPQPVMDASVSVEDEQGNSYPLYPDFMNSGGNYIAEDLPLLSGRNYRLRIETSEGKQYFSEFTPVKNTPDIDSVGWELKDGGLQVYVNTHDPSNATRYYRWEYEEAWEFHAPYRTMYKYHEEDSTVQFRTEEEMIYTCWDSTFSTTIITGSTTRLSEDVVYRQPLVFAAYGAEKMSVLYSILVKQYAMTREAFEYWETMKKNTEEIGSIFDPLPSNLRGNIYNAADPSEKVIGYISAGSVRERRFFIDNDDLPDNWNEPFFCDMINVPSDSITFYFASEAYIPLAEIYEGGSVSYTATGRSCVDCTLKGVTKKPDFWPR